MATYIDVDERTSKDLIMKKLGFDREAISQEGGSFLGTKKSDASPQKPDLGRKDD